MYVIKKVASRVTEQWIEISLNFLKILNVAVAMQKGIIPIVCNTIYISRTNIYDKRFF